jgi:hypothetical protein
MSTQRELVALKNEIAALKLHLSETMEMAKLTARKTLEQQDQINCLRDDVEMLLDRNGLVSTMFPVPRE